MAGSLHGSARTTPRVRAELQASQETTNILAQRYGLSRTTVAKWRNRTTTDDAPMGPSSPRSTVLTQVEEAMVVEFRRRTLLPLDDVLGCLRDSIPKLTRSSLHRCLERHGISRLPEGPDKASKRGKFTETAIGYVHIDISELRLAEGKLNMFLAIDRVSKFTYVEFRDDAGKMNGAESLRGVVKAFPYAIHTVLTDNGMAFADLLKNRNGPTRRYLGAHIFDRVCAENGIKHRLTKPYHPWTNGQAERMNRTVKEATIKAFHYPDLESLKAHVLAFVSAYNFAKHLKALRWKTPFEAVCHAWTTTPDVFKLNPRHLIPGPNTQSRRRTRPEGPGCDASGKERRAPMVIHLLQVPYDSGHRARRMGRGPVHLVEHGMAPHRLRGLGSEVRLRPIETASAFLTEIGTAFELRRAVSDAVAAAVRNGALPLVLSGNCNGAVGTVSGLQAPPAIVESRAATRAAWAGSAGG